MCVCVCGRIGVCYSGWMNICVYCFSVAGCVSPRVTSGHSNAACVSHMCVCVCVCNAALACAGAVCCSLFFCSGMCARRGHAILYSLSAIRTKSEAVRCEERRS